MVFYAIPGIVGFVLAAFGVAVLFVDELQESLKERRRARWFAAIVLVLIGFLGFFSDRIQRGQEKAALAQERQNAAKDRTNLLQQNAQLIQFGQTQATREDMKKLDTDLVGGFGRLEAAIKGLPAPPRPTQPAPPPTVERTHFTWRRAPSNNPSLPYGLQIIIQSDVVIDPVSFAIECTGPVGQVSSFISGQGAYMNVYNGPAEGHPNVAIVHFTFPPLKPETPLVVTILSKDDIRVKAIEKMPQ